MRYHAGIARQAAAGYPARTPFHGIGPFPGRQRPGVVIFAVMVFKAVFFATVVMVLGAAALVGGRFFGLIDPAPAATSSVCDALSSAQRKALVGEKTPTPRSCPPPTGYAAAAAGPSRRATTRPWSRSRPWTPTRGSSSSPGRRPTGRPVTPPSRRYASARSSSAPAPATGRRARWPPRSSSSTVPPAGRSGPWSSRTAGNPPRGWSPRGARTGSSPGSWWPLRG